MNSEYSSSYVATNGGNNYKTLGSVSRQMANDQSYGVIIPVFGGSGYSSSRFAYNQNADVSRNTGGNYWTMAEAYGDSCDQPSRFFYRTCNGQ